MNVTLPPIINTYAPTMTNTDEVKEQFYDDLSAVVQSTSHCDKLILLGDFNARVGRDDVALKKVIGHHSIGKENSNGTLLLTVCLSN